MVLSLRDCWNKISEEVLFFKLGDRWKIIVGELREYCRNLWLLNLFDGEFYLMYDYNNLIIFKFMLELIDLSL